MFDKESKDELVLTTGSQVGCSLVDGNGDGVLIESNGISDLNFLRLTSFGLLQGSRMRNIKTEYVSCPSCGRTLFDLQLVTAEIAESTGHLPGLVSLSPRMCAACAAVRWRRAGARAAPRALRGRARVGARSA